MIKQFLVDEIKLSFTDGKFFVNKGNDIRLPYNYDNFPHCILYISPALSKNCLLKIAALKSNPNANILLITDEKTCAPHLIESLEVEAVYSINKPIDGLIDLINSLISTEPLMNRDEFATSDDIFSQFHLTTKEIQILTLLQKGMSNKEIANTTKKSEGTVKVQLKSIFKKLNVHSRAEVMNRFMSVA